ncbi:amidohydrolase [Luteimonas sp. A482]
MNPLVKALESRFKAMAPELLAIYEDLHRNPELSMREERSAGIAADWIERLGYEVSRGVGVTGVVGVLRNGDGPTVLLRGDMDALPMDEDTGLPYSSQVPGVAHSCGHDLHMAWLMGAARLLAEARDAWRGTLLVVFQPGEETAQGARAMVEDWDKAGLPRADVVLGQHVMVGAAGSVSYRPGVILSAGDSLQVRMFGRGAHGSQPQNSVDPVVMAASTVLRLQTIVSREVAPLDSAVLTVGSLQAGTKENIIPEEATIKLNMRTYDERVRAHMLDAVRRICCAEAHASAALKEPEFTTLSSYPLTENDHVATAKVVAAFHAQFGDRARETRPSAASEDFSIFGRSWGVPYVFWFVGGTDPATYEQHRQAGTVKDIPDNHSPRFAPVLDPTLRTGLEAMLAAASAWLCAPDAGDSPGDAA